MSVLDRNQHDNLIISDDVFASIVSNAVKDVEGFGSFSNRTPDVISQTLPTASTPKPIKIVCSDNDVQIQMYINVKEGTNAQDVSKLVQRAVKTSVQSITGKVVTKVNVCVQGVDFVNLEN